MVFSGHCAHTPQRAVSVTHKLTQPRGHHRRHVSIRAVRYLPKATFRQLRIRIGRHTHHIYAVAIAFNQGAGAKQGTQIG